MMNETPKTEDELERYLRGVEKVRNASDFPTALEACQPLMDEPTTLAAGLRARADIYADMRKETLNLLIVRRWLTLDRRNPATTSI